MSDILYPLYRDELFSKAKKFSDYEKLKVLHRSVCFMLEKLEEKVEVHGKPRNPRQDIMQRMDQNNLRGLQQRKKRLEEKMIVLEQSIKEDIDQFNGKVKI